MSKHIETKKGLNELLKRYKEAGVTDTTLDDDGECSQWITVIKNCIDGNLAMDETDYENTPKRLKKLWVGLK